MSVTTPDHFHRLEQKISQAIEHIERLTLENENLRSSNTSLKERLRELEAIITRLDRERHDQTAFVHDRLAGIQSLITAAQKK